MTEVAPPSSSLLKSRSGRVDVADLTPNNIGQLRKLNAALFPVRFGEKWYKDVLSKEVSDICKFALYNDVPVASVCCRYEIVDEEKDTVDVYIMTLGCLAPYRRLGLGKKLLEHILCVAGPGKGVKLSQKTGQASTNVCSELDTNGHGSSGKQAESEGGKHASYTVRSVYLHVQTGNEEARSFYESQGFRVIRQTADYYKIGILPRSAWVLEKR